jgi:transketolase
MRNAFIDELVLLARRRDNIALVVGDLGYSVVEPFAREFPERFINAGVAEQNMTGLAAGMASEGYHVFTYSIANFPTFRCAEQIRNDVDYHKLAVSVVTVGGGLAYGPLGYSHHAVQDYALIRSMPNMLIAAPGDPMEVRACLRYLVQNPQPSYLRLGKAGEPCFHHEVPEVQPGKWLPVKTTSPEASVCYLTTGATLEIAMNASAKLQSQNIDVYSMPLWGMTSKKAQCEQLTKWKSIITFEDHLIDGGFGSWMLEAMPQGRNLREKISIQGLDSVICGAVGKQSTLNKLGGLTSV